LALTKQSAVAPVEIGAERVNRDKVGNEMKSPQTLDLRSPKKSGVAKKFLIDRRSSKQTPQNIRSASAKVLLRVMEEKPPRGSTIRIKKQIDQRAESETPFFQQPDHDIALPLAAGRNREDIVRRAGAFKTRPA